MLGVIVSTSGVERVFQEDNHVEHSNRASLAA